MRGVHNPQENLFFCNGFETGTVLFQLLARPLQIWSFPLGVGNNTFHSQKGTYWVGEQ